MNLPGLSIPQTDLNFRIHREQKQVWDIFRKKWVSITPEEWVRQQVLHFMVKERQFTSAMIALESGLKFGQKQRRTDARIFLPGGDILLLLEFKAPSVKLELSAILQASVYAGVIQPQNIFLSNGLNHYWISRTAKNEQIQWHSGIPYLHELISA
jgi:hypothetical protein